MRCPPPSLLCASMVCYKKMLDGKKITIFPQIVKIIILKLNEFEADAVDKPLHRRSLESKGRR